MIKIDKYEKLSKDLKAAVESTENMDFGTDDGTLNCDCPAIFLTRWNEEKTVDAAKKAGIYAVKCETGFFRGAYTFVIPGTFRASARSKRADAIVAALSNMGYRACTYSNAD